jgi:hypothetical protein
MPRFPKKTPKEDAKKSGDKDKELKVSLKPFEGTLRKLTDKELILETEGGDVRHFRLLAKTQFRDPKGDSVRDSLLQPGDRVTVQVNADDEETALRVILDRSGSAEERTAASKPVEESAAKPDEDAPRPAGSAPARTPAASAPASSAPAAKDEPAPVGMASAASATRRASRTVEPERDESAPVEPRRSSAAPGSDEDIIDAARDAAGRFMDDLPNFIVQMETTRSASAGVPPRWQVQDVVTAEVTSVNGEEKFRNIKVNGRTPATPVEKSGAWSTGDFSSTLLGILAPSSNARFKRSGADLILNRPTTIFDYSVDQPNSQWTLIAENDQKYKTAFAGRIWVDDKTRRVLRIEQHAVGVPSSFPYDRTEVTIEYGFVRIELGTYLLPVEGENTGCTRGSNHCSRNTIAFRNYRKFTAESSISFEK